MNKYVAYYRVSTTQQQRSGLGLDAQKNAVAVFTKNCTDCIIAEFVETENSSGKNDKRVELDKAIKLATEKDATLLIAKLDRLSRNVSFIFALMDTKVKFVCCDIPEANTLTIGIFAVMAQHERETIAKRTKAALDEKLKRDGEWRKNVFTDAQREKAYATHTRKATENENNRKATNYAKMLRKDGMTYLQIAERLNAEGFETAASKKGGKQYKFSKTTVKRLLERP